MNPFIRHFPKERIVYFVRQAIEMLVSLRPYAACRTSATCPCPAASSRPVTGIAIGHEVTLNMRSRKPAERRRVEFPKRKEGEYVCLPQSRP